MKLGLEVSAVPNPELGLSRSGPSSLIRHQTVELVYNSAFGSLAITARIRGNAPHLLDGTEFASILVAVVGRGPALLDPVFPGLPRLPFHPSPEEGTFNADIVSQKSGGRVLRLSCHGRPAPARSGQCDF
jgi:hypothetical protein